MGPPGLEAGGFALEGAEDLLQDLKPKGGLLLGQDEGWGDAEGGGPGGEEEEPFLKGEAHRQIGRAHV